MSYRACVTKAPNRAPFAAPQGYNASDFELHRRYIKGLVAAGKPAPTFEQMFGVYRYRGYPGWKYDLCDSNTFAVTSDMPDVQRYIMGSHAEREEVRSSVRYYVEGLLHTLAHDAEIPLATRHSTKQYGLCQDEWPENGHFPPQMYVREGVRIVGDAVFTQKDWLKAQSHESVGIGSWGMDIHVVHRYVNEVGHVENEGFSFPNTG